MNIRVWIETDSAITRAGLESLLESNPLVGFAASPSDADAVLREDSPDPQERLVPSVMLSDQRFTSRLARLGVHAVLPRQSSPEQIFAALYAAAAGLVVIPAESLPHDSQEIEIENLTPREMEALEMLAEGLSNKQIAGRLGISEHTAKFHVNSILNKLGAGTRTDAVVRALRRGVLKV